MQTDKTFFEDLARVMSGAAGAMQGAASEAQQVVRQRLERLMGEMNFAHRDELEAARAMAAQARAEQEALATQVAALNARVDALAAQVAAQAPPPAGPAGSSGAPDR